VASNRSAARRVRLATVPARKDILDADPAEAGIPVDDMPNPFREGTEDPVAYLDRMQRDRPRMTGAPCPPGT
jgi:hypothetical protein